MPDPGFSNRDGQTNVQVLVVDDDPLICALLKLHLAHAAGLQVVGVAYSGAQGVELCASLQPQVVVMDYMMPEMDGLAATRLIRGRHLAIQVVMLSATFNDELEARAAEAGVFACVPKLSFRKELVESVSAAAGKGREQGGV